MQWLNAIKEMTLPPLVSGSHSDPEHGLCAMEMVAFMERLPHTDKPECTCPVIGKFVIATNDMLDDEQRQKLLPVLPELVDTVVNTKLMRERERMICHRAIQSFEHQTRHRYREMDFERDRMRHYHGHDRYAMEEAQHLVSGGVVGAVKLLVKLYPPFLVADILIGILREALVIGATKPKTQFRKTARVKELATVTYLPTVRSGPQESIAPFGALQQKPMIKYVMPHFGVVDPKKAFMAIDCVA